MVSVGRPWTPSVPLLANWMAPPCVIATVHLMGWMVRRRGAASQEGIWVSKMDTSEFTYCIVRCWFGKWVWGQWRWWLRGRPQSMNPPQLSPPRWEGQRGHRMKGHWGFSCWWNHNTFHSGCQSSFRASVSGRGLLLSTVWLNDRGENLLKSMALVNLQQNTIITCTRGVVIEFLGASESRSNYQLTPVNPHFPQLWRSGKYNHNELLKT